MPELTGPSLQALADAAFRQAAAKLVRRAQQMGTPLIVWEDGQVRELSPDEAQRRLADLAPLPPLNP